MIDQADPSQKAIHDKIVSLVDRILELHKRKNDLPPSAERERIEREIAVTDETLINLYSIYTNSRQTKERLLRRAKERNLNKKITKICNHCVSRNDLSKILPKISYRSIVSGFSLANPLEARKLGLLPQQKF